MSTQIFPCLPEHHELATPQAPRDNPDNIDKTVVCTDYYYSGVHGQPPSKNRKRLKGIEIPKQPEHVCDFDCPIKLSKESKKEEV